MKIKNEDLNKIILFLIGFMVFISCSKNIVSQSKYKQIDAGVFVLNTPSNYKLIKDQGIDSYVGRVTNGNIEFTFDYGWYSNSKPRTYYDYVDKYLLRIHQDELKETCGITDSIMENVSKDFMILDAKRNPNYPSKSNKEISTTIKVGTGNCTIYLLPINPDISFNYEQYNFEEQINGELRSKLFYPKRDYNDAGIFIENLEEKRENRFNYNKLSFRTNNFNESNSEEIIGILKSIKIKHD